MEHTTVAATANVAPGFHPVTVVQSCADRLEDEERETLIRHTSKLPALFYLLSFAPPLPSLVRQPRAFFDHPSVLYALGTLFAIVAGFSGFPVFDMLYGVYWTNRISGDASADQIRHASDFAGVILFSTAICSFIFTWAFQVCFAKASGQLSQRMRHAYVAAVLAQDASYFDHHGAGEVATFAGKEMNTVRTALGEKMGMTIMLFTILVASLIVGFSICARVTGFLFAVVPILVALFALLAHASDKVSAPALRYEGRASSFLEEIMSSMRIVQSFNMAKPLLSKYNDELLRKVEQYARRKALVRGAEAGIVYFSLFLTYSAAFWWVGHELVRGKIPIGDGLTSFWNLINSLFAFSTAVPQLAAVLEAMTVIKTLRRAIERQPRIDVRETSGVRVEEHAISPEFVLHDVTLAYPSRPSIPSLKEVSMTLQAGKVTALVGPSGSGKSTITSLLLREYDPETANVMLPSDEKDLMIEQGKEKKKKSAKKQKEELSTADAEKEADRLERAISGEHAIEDEDEKFAAKSARGPIRGGGYITYSGVDTRKLNLRWLRSQVAIVRQNPQIFSATVFENVAAGLSGTRWAYRPNIDDAPDASDEIKQRTAAIREKVRSALAKAQALDFVERLPEGLDTLISGGKTGILSGGQRQRLSLARVLVREPRVLIIDEGTSAIDTNTEDRIRVMLEQEHATRGMTTILIAHRLSTVEKADKIVVMRNGRVVDQGSHAELMERKRSDQTYREMVMHQRAILETDGDSDDIEAERRVSRDPSPSGSDSSKSDRDEMRGREEVLSDTSTKYVAASTIYPLHTDEEEMRKRQDARPSLTARRSRRASDHTSWTVSGRNLATSNQLEHSAESAKNAVDLHKGIYSSSNKRKEGEEGSESAAIDAGSDQTTHRTKMQLFKNFLQVLSIVKFEFGCGVLGAFLAGGLFPLSGWVTGKAVNALNSPTNAEITSGTELWSLIFLCIAIAGLILITLQSYLLESASERITRYLKGRSLGALMEQEIGFFDRAEASSGALASSVSTYPASLTAATGLILSQVLISLSNLFGSVLLAFILSWRGALVIMAPVVLLFFSGWINISMLEKYESTLLEPAAQGASYIAENVDAIKEISALGRERETLRLYDERTHVQTPKQTRYLIWGGGGYAFSQSVVYATGALVFYYGGSLLANRTASFTEVYAIFEAAIIGVFAAGRIFQFTGDFSRAISAFKAMCDWFDRKPQIAYLPPEGGDADKLKRDWPNEDIIFKDVELRYPRRPNHPAIRNLNLRIHANQHQAFCGTSGSGKSTILQMVQRFYDPYRGTITVGDCDIRRIELLDLRKTMSYVSQDACLYEGSIKFNLLLGAAEGQTVSDEELEAACQDACIADFINGLPDGWETDIGAKGTQLSGGQRQRICIARALIKKPRILLLDEATSALDAQAEVSVQKALDNASKGRTTLTVAHRLSTIRNADVIHVVEDGAIVESGSHDQLIARRGRYLELVQAQL